MTSEVAAYISDALTNAVEPHALDSACPSLVVHATREAAAPLHANANPIRVSSDEDLLIQVSNGSREALSILFKRHARSVFNVARRILRDDPEAEDLLQELFLFFFHKARLYDAAKGSAASWIIQMTYHRAIDRRRYLTARHHYNALELNEERHHATGGQISIDEVTARMLLSRLHGELSAEQLQTLELHFFEGYTFQEIADNTGQTFGNVRHHYYRGLERLRAYVFPEKHG
jgi:RNA polymerase sigma-70 factor (ECF subfamily)